MSSKALRRAVQDKDLSKVKQLIAMGVDVNERSKNGRTALHQICVIEDAEETYNYVKCLLEAQADPNACDKSGWRPIHIAMEWGYWKSALLLIEHKADVNSVDDEGWTSLHYAVMGGVCPPLVRLSIEAGCSVQATATDYNLFGTPLELHARILPSNARPSDATFDVIDILLEAGAKTNEHKFPDNLERYLQSRVFIKRIIRIIYGILRKRWRT